MKMYACTVEGCDAVFEQPASLGRHAASKHKPRQECRWCHQTFAGMGITKHEPTCEQNPDHDKTFICGRCDGEFLLTGKARHDGACKNYSPDQILAKRASNALKRGLPLPANAPVSFYKMAKSRGLLPEQMQTGATSTAVVTAPAPAPAPVPATVTGLIAAPGAGTLASLAASLPHVADPLSALMNLLAEVEELRSSGGQNAQAQIESLTVERDEAIKRAEEAEGKLATLRSVFG